MEYVVLLYNGLKVKYHSCRKQFVQYNSYNSSLLHITCGVRQGSILGPLLFLVCINDLCSVSKVLELILFADTTGADPGKMVTVYR